MTEVLRKLDNRLDSPVQAAVSVVSETVKQRKRPLSGEMKKAVAWRLEHPDLMGLALRPAAEQAGVTYSTLNRAGELIAKGLEKCN